MAIKGNVLNISAHFKAILLKIDVAEVGSGGVSSDWWTAEGASVCSSSQ